VIMTTKEKTIGKHKLTLEMDDFIDAVVSGENVKAYAYAGSGKSTLLRAVEKYHVGKTGLYICYNKSLEQEARKLFSGHHVNIATSHSFALNSFEP
ncbi:ATP-dependent helicase, partial [Vibrio breoganii]